MFKLSNGELTDFGLGTDVRLSNGEDWIIEAGVVGNQLSMKIWRDGDPEPTTPQLMATDLTPLPDGQLGVASYVATGHEFPFSINATFDNIYFTPIPEPSACVLLFLGITFAVSGVRRRPRH